MTYEIMLLVNKQNLGRFNEENAVFVSKLEAVIKMFV